MPVEYAFEFPLSNGLHGRPASHLSAAAGGFAADVTLVNERTRAAVNAKSVLALVGADVQGGDPCRLRFVGPDEAVAERSVVAFVRDVLPTVDDVEAVTAADRRVDLPRSLTMAGADRLLRGAAASPGVGRGTVVGVGGWRVPDAALRRPAGPEAAERQAFADARRSLAGTLQAQVDAGGQTQSEILRAHLSIVEDVSLADFVGGQIGRGRSAVQALSAAADHFAATLAASQSEYLRERALDVRDVTGQLLQLLCGGDRAADAVALVGPSVVVAEELTPGQFLALDKRHLAGLALGHGAVTSHTVILARAAGVPTVVDLGEAVRQFPPGATAIVDGGRGVAVVDPAEPVRRFYRLEQAKIEAVREGEAATQTRPGRTADGRVLEVGVNVAGPDEVAPAVARGAEGVGLFRTEMVFMDRPAAPTEDEQADLYGRAAEAAQGRPVIIRLLDAGGDKPVPYLNLPHEANPFLGYRAVRFYEAQRPLVLTQMRAVLRACGRGDVRVLVPMVSCVEEVRAVRAMLNEAAASLAAEGRPVAAVPPLGIMIEVPSAAAMADVLAREADFFSIGSNDLTQYLLAADRDNPHLSHLYGWGHPAVLRTLRAVVDAARSAGKWVGLCGEMADVPAALPALVGLGLNEISVAGPRVPAVKRALSGLRHDDCRAALDRACASATRAEAEAALATAAGGAADLPLLSPDLVALDLDVTTKAEAIKALADRLTVTGRSPRDGAVEEAVWQREETYSTGFGFGVAVPHCKTDAVSASSVVVGRLRRAVDWESMDGKPVDVVLMLVMRAAGGDVAKEHLRVFARLSRLVMQEEFRDRLRAAGSEDELRHALAESLGVTAG